MTAQIPKKALSCKSICGLFGDMYSPNLRRWLKKQRHEALPVLAEMNGSRWLLWEDSDDCYASGSRLGQILTQGTKAQVWAVPWAVPGPNAVADRDFWHEYAKHGRCAIDPKHEISFIGGETRWDQRATRRKCIWCGRHTQRLKKWTEKVSRSAWVPDNG